MHLKLVITRDPVPSRPAPSPFYLHLMHLVNLIRILFQSGSEKLHLRQWQDVRYFHVSFLVI
jgi:hypothetical protein